MSDDTVKYFNTLSTPSGIECKLYEIQNREYVVLLKFLQGEDFTNFFNTLDQIISRSIPDIKNMNIIDKMYIYIAFYYYNINPSIPITHPKLGQTGLDLGNVLNDIETAYVSNDKIFEITDKIQVAAHYARDFYFEDGKPQINYGTCVSKIKKEEWESISSEESEKLLDVLPTDKAMKIEMYTRNTLSAKINVFNLPMMEPFYVDINSPELIFFVYNIFKENLQNYYSELYISVQYLKMDKAGFDSLTPAETSIILKIMADDKEKQNQEAKKSGGMNIPSAAISDDVLF